MLYNAYSINYIYVSASPSLNTEGEEAVKCSLPKKMSRYTHGSTNGSVNLIGDLVFCGTIKTPKIWALKSYSFKPPGRCALSYMSYDKLLQNNQKSGAS